jgi:hypothetical protein
MHNKQKQLLALIDTDPNIGSYSLRTIADKIGVPDKPQIVKYHLLQLEKAGMIQMNLEQGVIKSVKRGLVKSTVNTVFSLPVVGSANNNAEDPAGGALRGGWHEEDHNRGAVSKTAGGAGQRGARR